MQVIISPNWDEYSHYFLEIQVHKHHHGRKEINTDVRIVHSYLNIVKASTNEKAGILNKRKWHYYFDQFL